MLCLLNLGLLIGSDLAFVWAEEPNNRGSSAYQQPGDYGVCLRDLATWRVSPKEFTSSIGLLSHLVLGTKEMS